MLKQIKNNIPIIITLSIIILINIITIHYQSEILIIASEILRDETRRVLNCEGMINKLNITRNFNSLSPNEAGNLFECRYNKYDDPKQCNIIIDSILSNTPHQIGKYTFKMTLKFMYIKQCDSIRNNMQF
jgi:hypothetical protein